MHAPSHRSWTRSWPSGSARTDPCGLRQSGAGGEQVHQTGPYDGLDEVEVVRGVDREGLHLGDLDGEEAALVQPAALQPAYEFGSPQVEVAVELQEGAGAVLATREARGLWKGAPDCAGAIDLDARRHRVEARNRHTDRAVCGGMTAQQGDGLGKPSWIPQGARRLQQEHGVVRRVALRLGSGKSMGDDRAGRRSVGGELGRPQERHIRSEGARHRRDLLVVGADDDATDLRNRARSGDRVSDERHTTQLLEVLAGQTAGSTSGRNHGQDALDHQDLRSGAPAYVEPGARPTRLYDDCRWTALALDVT